jgi:predicted DNA-binding transcriptional regulator AlpA
MTDQKNITRHEIAKLMGISYSSLCKLISMSDFTLPAPTDKSGRALTYCESAIVAWIATEPLSNVSWPQSAKTEPAPPLDAASVRLFLSGDMGVSTAQKNRHRLRKIAAKHGQSKTQRVEVAGCDDYHGANNTWAGLV